MLSWLDTLVDWWAVFSNEAASWEAYASGWTWPLNVLYPFFVLLSNVVDGIFSALFDFRLWLYALVADLDVVFSWQAVIDVIQSVLDSLSGLLAWFSDWWYQVQTVIDWYWSIVSEQVQTWIATATEGLLALLVAWDDFFTNTLPTLFDLPALINWWGDRLVDIADIIDSAFVDRADLWSGWTDFRQSVSDFFEDPLEWLWSNSVGFLFGSGYQSRRKAKGG